MQWAGALRISQCAPPNRMTRRSPAEILYTAIETAAGVGGRPWPRVHSPFIEGAGHQQGTGRPGHATIIVPLGPPAGPWLTPK